MTHHDVSLVADNQRSRNTFSKKLGSARGWEIIDIKSANSDFICWSSVMKDMMAYVLYIVLLNFVYRYPTALPSNRQNLSSKIRGNPWNRLDQKLAADSGSY